MKKLLNELREFNEEVNNTIDIRNLAQQLQLSDNTDLSEIGEELETIDVEFIRIPSYSKYGIAYRIKGASTDIMLYEDGIFYDLILDKLDQETEYDEDNMYKLLMSYVPYKEKIKILREIILENNSTTQTILQSIGFYRLQSVEINDKLCFVVR